MNWLYNTAAGNLEVVIDDTFARITNVPDKFTKLFIGNNFEEKLQSYIEAAFGFFNYRTALRTFPKIPLTQEKIDANLNRFKLQQKIQRSLAERRCGEYDVLQEFVLCPYTECHFTVLKDDISYTTAGSNAEEVHKELSAHFLEEGYYKIWNPKPGEKPIMDGLAPVPVWDYRFALP